MKEKIKDKDNNISKMKIEKTKNKLTYSYVIATIIFILCLGARIIDLINFIGYADIGFSKLFDITILMFILKTIVRTLLYSVPTLISIFIIYLNKKKFINKKINYIIQTFLIYPTILYLFFLLFCFDYYDFYSFYK